MRLDDEIAIQYRESREAFLRGDISEAERIYRSLRAAHSIELFYEVDLPEHLMFVHPVGTVLGRATYGDHLVIYQNVGVGSDLNNNRPMLGRGVVLFPGAKVLGNTRIGDNVFVTANTVVQDVVVPDNCVVFPSVKVPGASQGERPINTVGCAWKRTRRSVMAHFFGA